MKRLILLLFVASLAALAGKAQDTVVLKHQAYTSIFCKSAHVPVCVTYRLHKGQINCTPKIHRTDDFKADPQCAGTNLKRDYAGNGYDQGHCMSADDNQCSLDQMHECFYYTNMLPQLPNLNRGTWKQYEEHERALANQYDSVHVWIGWYGIDRRIGPDSVVVPQWCWKVIYIAGKTDSMEVYTFRNTPAPSGVANWNDKQEPSIEQMAWINYCINHWQ